MLSNANFPVDEDDGEVHLAADSPPPRTTKYSEASLPSGPQALPKPLPPPGSRKVTPRAQSPSPRNQPPMTTSTLPQAMVAMNSPPSDGSPMMDDPLQCTPPPILDLPSEIKAELTGTLTMMICPPPSGAPSSSSSSSIQQQQKQSTAAPAPPPDIISSPSEGKSESPTVQLSELLITDEKKSGDAAVLGVEATSAETGGSNSVYVHTPNSTDRLSKQSTGSGSVSLGYSDIGGKANSTAQRMLCLPVRVENGLALTNITTSTICKKCNVAHGETTFDLYLDKDLETGEGNWLCNNCEFVNFMLYRFQDLHPKIKLDVRKLEKQGVSFRKPVARDLPFYNRSQLKSKSFIQEAREKRSKSRFPSKDLSEQDPMSEKLLSGDGFKAPRKSRCCCSWFH
eukprot:TRINITY_DN3077_c0_g1_i1.p1 TRINITY_DN3077_c0_g1~~TRINITY_DN3077_c0_g1_i1.p1  ORF type:complete len:397 (-),score=95.58 TRINITY_DN3077_c0_g1_i1:24-1214(-)